ncbi:MAG: tetratricopeptide repeat protein [Prevotella sp.]|jgi:tetratricopeptide (TPR) repeat protein|nr:tetratricopeptide repeat protein [Prevotella sp.]MCI1282919.1 tetratricopeptide repeat protein [Prevotella sp.]
MKAIKYLIVATMLFASATVSLAQEPDYKAMLQPIANALKASPGNALAAKDEVKQYTKTFKKNPQALEALGEAFLMAKTYDKANEYADLALAKNKNFGPAYVLKGDVAAMQDNGGDASMWYQQAMDMDPKNPTGYMRYANVNRKADPEGSEKALKTLKQNCPNFPIEAEAAHTFYTAGNYTKALEYYNQADINNLEDWRISEYAVTAYMNNQKDKALEVAQYGINKFPNDVTFERIALWSNTDLGKFQDALNNAQKVLNDTCKKSARDYTYYGLALKGAGQYDNAIAQYNKVMEMDKEDYKPLQYISEAYLAAGNEDKAVEYSQKYMDKNPNATPSDYAKLANAYVAKAKKDTANKQDNINKALAIYDNMATKYPSIAGWAYNQAGNGASDAGLDDVGAKYYQKTIDLLEAKTNRDADETGYLKQAYQLIGYYYWATKNDLESAKPYYQKLLVLDPNDKNANAALAPAPAEDNTTKQQ